MRCEIRGLLLSTQCILSKFLHQRNNIMAPNNQFTGVLNPDDAQTIDGGLLVDVTELKHAHKRKIKLNWRNIALFTVVHLQAVYGLWLIFTSAKVLTFVFGKGPHNIECSMGAGLSVMLTLTPYVAYFLYITSGFGITAGSHRLWAHRSYKARFPLRVMLMIFQTMAFQDSAYHWARDHRVHHKFSETDADPHNATR